MRMKCPCCGKEVEVFVYPDRNYLNNVRVELVNPEDLPPKINVKKGG